MANVGAFVQASTRFDPPSQSLEHKLARGSESVDVIAVVEIVYSQSVTENSKDSEAFTEQTDASISRLDSSAHGSPGHQEPKPAAGRTTRFITYEKARNLLDASFFAAQIGLPLNRFVTIHWEQAGILVDFQKVTGRFLKLAGDWLRLQGSEFAWVWVREGGPKDGEHVHILMHVPPHLARAFSYRQRRWLKACGANFGKGVIKSRPVGRSNRHAFVGVQGGECYMGHLGRALDYILKGAASQTRHDLGITRAKSGGVLFGKRCSTSQNIGWAARKKYGMHDLALPPARNCTRRGCDTWTDLHRTDDIACLECSAQGSEDALPQTASPYPRPTPDGFEGPWRA